MIWIVIIWVYALLKISMCIIWFWDKVIAVIEREKRYYEKNYMNDIIYFISKVRHQQLMKY